jgi:hypothetical protein
MKKAYGLLILFILTLSSTASATVLQLDNINNFYGQTVSWTFKNVTEGGLSGQMNGTLDSSFATGAYCVQIDKTTYIPGTYNIQLRELQTDQERKAAWLMSNYMGYTDNTIIGKINGAALQLAIWETYYGDLFIYNPNGSIGDKYSFYLDELSKKYSLGSCSDINFAISPDSQNLLVKVPAPVPEPATLLILGSGLICIAVFRKRNK